MKVKIISNEDGKCPYCNSTDINYDAFEAELPSYVYQPCFCNTCKRYFEAWYDLHFTGHSVGDMAEYEAADVINTEIEYE